MTVASVNRHRAGIRASAGQVNTPAIAAASRGFKILRGYSAMKRLALRSGLHHRPSWQGHALNAILPSEKDILRLSRQPTSSARRRAGQQCRHHRGHVPLDEMVRRTHPAHDWINVTEPF